MYLIDLILCILYTLYISSRVRVLHKSGPTFLDDLRLRVTSDIVHTAARSLSLFSTLLCMSTNSVHEHARYSYRVKSMCMICP